MTALLTTFAASNTSGLGALGVNGSAFIIQLITFVLAYLVLRRYAFGPIVKLLQARREKIESGVTLSEQLAHDKVALDKQVAETLQKARRQADDILAEAQETARSTVREAETKAGVKAESIVKEAHQRTMQDAQRVRRSIEADVINLVAEATETVLGEKIDPHTDDALIRRAVKEQQTA